MHISWQEAVMMPREVIEHDIAMMNFEATERPEIEQQVKSENDDLPPPGSLG